MTNNVELIRQSKTSKIYYFLYTKQSTKYEIKEKLNLRHNDVYNKKKGEQNAFDLLFKNDYIEKIGVSERGSPIYQSTPKPLIEKIQNELENINKHLTSFEQWVLTTILDSQDTRNVIGKYYSKDFKEKIDAYDIIIEEYLGNFIFGNYVNNNIILETPLFEPNESKKKFLKIWNGKDQMINQIDQDFNIIVPAIQQENKQISGLLLPTFLREKQINRYLNLPRETGFYSKWMALPNSLIVKLIIISPKLQNYLFVFTDTMRTFLPFVILGVIKPKSVFNRNLRNIIINKKKNIQQVLSRHSDFGNLFKNNGT